jgi:hypothetical protein
VRVTARAKLTAVTPHGSFTRSTDRPYTFVVISPVSDGDIQGAEDALDRRLAELALIPEGQDQFVHVHSYYGGKPSSWVTYDRAYCKKEIAKAERYLADLIDRRAKDLWLICSWHERRDLAEKQANQLRSSAASGAAGSATASRSSR